MMKRSLLATLFAMPLALSPNAYADDASGTSPVKISGYGTAALTMTNTNDAQFGRPNQASGAGKDARTGVDSNLGLQAAYQANDWLSGTVQGLVRKDGEDDYGGELTWAFVKAKLSDTVSVRAGRIVLPVFMISDYRNVGYANTMLRPPGEVYSQVPLNSLDGVDATWQRGFGDTTLTAQLALGSTKAPIATGAGAVVHAKGKRIHALNLVAERGPLTLRFGRFDTRLTVDDSTAFNGLVAALRGAGAGYGFSQLGVLANDLAVSDKKASFTSVGLGLDWNNIVVQSEYAKRKVDSYIPDTSSWYLMGGYRVGKFLPYYSHASLKIDSRVANTVPRACPAGYPAACAPTMAALSAGVDALLSSSPQSTDTVGVRWDFSGSAALKLQIDRVKPKDGSGLLLQPAPGFKGPVTVGAIAIDFVF